MKRPKSLEPSKADDIELPESAQTIAEVIGREATLKLARGVRNRKLYVPKTLCAGHASIHRRMDNVTRPRCTCKGHWIAKTIGDDLAVKLSWYFGGETLDLAPCYHVHAFERNLHIREQFAAGATRLELRQQHGLSERAIRYIVKGFNGRQDRPSGERGERGASCSLHPPGLGPSPLGPHAGGKDHP